MKTFSLAALILATTGTGLLSGVVLMYGFMLVPELGAAKVALLVTAFAEIDRALDEHYWFWIVIFTGSMAIILSTGALLLKVRLHQRLIVRCALAVISAYAVQVAFTGLGISTIETALAHVNTPVQARFDETHWSSLNRHRLMLTGLAVASLMYSVALSIQIRHDDRGIRRV